MGTAHTCEVASSIDQGRRAKILSGTAESIRWLSYDRRTEPGYNSFTDVSGLPDVGVPAGFTNVV